MKIAILTSGYPSLKNIYNNGFVHQRSIYYKKMGHDVDVFVPSKSIEKYEIDGINVNMMPAYDITNEIGNHDIYCIHLLGLKPNKKTDGSVIYKKIEEEKIPFALFIHGDNALPFDTYKFEKYSLRDYIVRVFKDFWVLPKIGKFVKNTIDKGVFIFPSEWMKIEAEKTFSIKFKEYSIIPNGIDTKLFKYDSSKYSKRFKILSIRSFNNRKYANDISINTMKFLPDNFHLTIYGKGKYLEECKKLAEKLELDNIEFIEKFIPHSDIPKIHNKHGIYLSPSRLDAQGVSMCEAQSSGFPVISSNIAAIPEFIVNNKNGFACNTPKEMANKILKISKDEDLFKKISSKAREASEKIRIDKTAEKEIKLFSSKLANKL